MRKPGEAGSSPYATGGGGVLLEHEYVASMLGSLLLGQPVDGLGDEFLPTQVALQQEAFAPVDDVVIRGISPGGDRTLLVACRRRPTLGRSSEATVALFADFLHVVIDKPAALASGELRLGLAVSGLFRPATELADLTEIARRQPDSTAFHAAVTTPGACSANVRRGAALRAGRFVAGMVVVCATQPEPTCRCGGGDLGGLARRGKRCARR